MSLFVKQYATKAKKFEVSAVRAERGIQLEVKTYETVWFEITDEQAETIIKALRVAMGAPAPAPKAKADDDY